MPIIDGYLLRNFFQAVAIFFVTFTGLFMVIDGFGNLEEFIQHGQRAGGLIPVVLEYYGVRSLVIFDRTSGVLTLLAAMFTFTALERHNELTALMAAGISRGRLARPLVGGVLLVSVGAAASRELVIPQFRRQLSITAQDLGGERGQPVKPQYDYRTDVFLNGRKAFSAEQRIEKPRFRMPVGLTHHGTQIVAEEAIFQEATDQRPAGYLLSNVTQPADMTGRRSLLLDGKPVLFCPGDTPWLEANQCYLESEVRVEQLVGGAWRRLASTWEMIQHLRSPSTDFGPDVRMAVHARLVQPLMDMTLLFLGLPLVLARESRNVFVAIGMCLGVVLGFFMVQLTCHALGTHYLITPAAAAWIPLAIFVPVAVVLSEPLRSS